MNGVPYIGCAVSQASVGGVMVSIVAFQAIDPGSIPGQRRFFVFHFKALACQGAFVPSGRVGFDSRPMQLFFIIPFYILYDYTGESSTGGYTVYVGLDLESGKTAMHSGVHGFCQ